MMRFFFYGNNKSNENPHNLVVYMEFKIFQIDGKSTFQNRYLKKEVYIR